MLLIDWKSGTGILIDNALGKFAGEDIFSDLDVAKIDAIPLTAPHRETDTIIVEASKHGDYFPLHHFVPNWIIQCTGYVNTFIVYPSTVWGRPSHKFASKKLSKTTSIQIPALISASIMRGGRTPCVGDARNIWNHVHIEESMLHVHLNIARHSRCNLQAADFYYKLFDEIVLGRSPSSGLEGHYILESGEYVMYDLSKAIAVALHGIGKCKGSDPVPLSAEELTKIHSVSFWPVIYRQRLT